MKTKTNRNETNKRTNQHYIAEDWKRNENLEKEIYYIQSPFVPFRFFDSFRFFFLVVFHHIGLSSVWILDSVAILMPTPMSVCSILSQLQHCICVFSVWIPLFYYNKFWFSTFCHWWYTDICINVVCTYTKSSSDSNSICEKYHGERTRKIFVFRIVFSSSSFFRFRFLLILFFAVNQV